MTRRLAPLDRLSDCSLPPRGLSQADAARSLALHGPNQILERTSHPWLALLEDTAKDPMIWFFGGTAALYGLVGRTTEAWTLLGAIAPLLGMDVYLHRRTNASTRSLASRLATSARVLRDGIEQEIPAEQVVPGDLVILRPGEPLPADGVLLAGAEIQVEESALTGEAYPVRKRPLSGDAPMQLEIDEAHWLLAGTRLLTGEARFRVVFTGRETLYAEIVRSATGSAHEITPLQAAIHRLVMVLMVGAIALCLLLAGIRLMQGHGWLDALVNAVTLATAAIPEEFPVVFTFFLGVGVYRLAKRQALVRKAVTVENIGRVTAICTDKTGTVTEGRLTLAHLHPSEPGGEDQLVRWGALASRAESGDPLDEAVLRAVTETHQSLADAERLATFPFTEDRKRETAVVRFPDGVDWAVTKGAPETILPLTELGESEREKWLREVIGLSDDAHKVVAVAASRQAPGAELTEEPSRALRFVGLIAFEDPIRPGVIEAVRECRAAGILTIMVTGDHPSTAVAVAREVGLGGDQPRVISGDELEVLVAAGRSSDLRSVDVVARATPAQKVLLVRGLKSLGEIVAVTGDGVNDVPALQAADIGLAMGGRGTQSAREAASIVLLDDNFRTIVGAIAEGRQLFRNLQTSFAYLLLIHLPFVLTAAVIPLLGFPPLYLPVHVVWLEMIIHPTAMLVFQDLPSRGGLTAVEPRAGAKFFGSAQWAAIVVTGLLATAAVSLGYLRGIAPGATPEHGRSIAMATLTSFSVATTVVLAGLRTRMARLVCLGAAGLSLLLIQTPALSRLIHLEPLHWDDWLLAVGSASAIACAPLLFRRAGYSGRGSTARPRVSSSS